MSEDMIVLGISVARGINTRPSSYHEDIIQRHRFHSNHIGSITSSSTTTTAHFQSLSHHEVLHHHCPCRGNHRDGPPQHWYAHLPLAIALVTDIVLSHADFAATKAVSEIMGRDPAVSAAYNDIVSRNGGIEGRDSLAKRACDGGSPCCDTKTGCRSRDYCWRTCAGIPGTGAFGCIAGRHITPCWMMKYANNVKQGAQPLALRTLSARLRREPDVVYEWGLVDNSTRLTRIATEMGGVGVRAVKCVPSHHSLCDFGSNKICQSHRLQLRFRTYAP